MNGAKSEGKVRSVPLEVGLSLQKMESSRGDERSNTKKRGVMKRSDRRSEVDGCGSRGSRKEGCKGVNWINRIGGESWVVLFLIVVIVNVMFVSP